jgi:sterol desaturase/sphingolipid hydroxylase (fatty acid hydroxylase superfamily)
MEFVRTYLGELLASSFTLAWTCAFFLCIETLFPRAGVRVTVASRLKSIVFWMVYSAVIILIAHGLMIVWRPLGVHPLLSTLAPAWLPTPAGIVVAAIASAFIGDFFYYWCHRAQHRFLWRFHAVHHSVREMSGVSAWHHVSEEFVQFALYSAPLAFFIDSPYGVPVLGAVLAWQGNFLHSPTRLSFGPFRRYLVDNRVHRIHHSLEERHFDKNFGIFTTLWDSLFGTLYMPAPGEWPQTGVADFPEPATVGEFLLSPFTARFRAKPGPVADPVRTG